MLIICTLITFCTYAKFKESDLIFVLDVDGGWGDWEVKFDQAQNCTTTERECNNPTPCGNGIYCIGENVQSSDCPGIKRFNPYWKLEFLQKVKK